MINWLENLNKPKNWLVLANVFLVFFLIVLGNAKIIPLQFGDFIFFAILVLAFALWRPGWAFLFFCGTISLENINLAPASLSMMIRPYQFIGAILIVAVIVRFFTGRLNFKLAKFNLADWAVLVLVAAGFVSAVVAFVETRLIASLHLAVILATFVALYFLVRNFIQDATDFKKTLPFFLSSAIVVVLYGIWQNIAFIHGWNSFETMPGRPNATFAEADWLGGYLAVVISIIYILLYGIFNFQFSISNQFSSYKFKILKIFSYGLLVLLFTALILTVSRSAWLAAFVSYVVFVLIFFTDLKLKNWKWKETSFLKLKIISSLVVAILIVYVFHLTNFQLGNRVQSTGSGLQKITVVCNPECGRDALQCVSTETVIKDTLELERYGCRHINLEDIENEKAAGNFVTEIYRPDPNISIRSQIYQKSWAEIKNHPLLGIGWGSIGKILGTDARGATLNSSNIFLETYLGAGVLGLLSLVVLLGYILWRAIKNYHASAVGAKPLQIFVIASWFGVVIFNLFNAGIFLGFLWVWLAISCHSRECGNPVSHQ